MVEFGIEKIRSVPLARNVRNVLKDSSFIDSPVEMKYTKDVDRI